MNKNVSKSKTASELIFAQPNLCWDSANLMFEEGFSQAAYVEGAVVMIGLQPTEHAWVVQDGMIVDPTLPEKDLLYLPAHIWTYDDFQKIHFRRGGKPFFRRVEFLVNGVQVEMDKARAAARAAISDSLK